MTRCRTAKFHNVLVETVEESPLDQVIREQLDRYFQDLDGRQPVPLHPLLHEAVDRALYRYALRMCDGNQVKTAELLGIHRNTLHRRLRELGLYEGNF